MSLADEFTTPPPSDDQVALERWRLLIHEAVVALQEQE